MGEKPKPWIVMNDATAGDLAYAMKCLRCGNVQKVVTPISVDVYVAAARAYARTHSRCRKRNEKP